MVSIGHPHITVTTWKEKGISSCMVFLPEISQYGLPVAFGGVYSE